MARFLLLLLLPLLARSVETNCTGRQSHSTNGVSTATLLMKGGLTKGKVVGGLEVIKMVEQVIDNLPLTKFLRDQKAEVDEIVKKMTEEAKTYVAALNDDYFAYLDKLQEHINASEQVAQRLIRLAIESWMNCGINAEDILEFGYTKTAQQAFAKFLESAIDDSKDITERLESIKTELDKLKVEAQTNERLIQQYFDAEIARLEREKDDKKDLYWICLIPVACPFVAITVSDAIKQANNCIAYMNDVSAQCMQNFENAESQTDDAICLMQAWIPASHALTTALEQTERDNDALLPVLEAAYIEEHPEEAGRYNAYLVRLFKDMQGLQSACEDVKGFDMDEVQKMGVNPVPDYPDQPKVCACLEIKNLDDWMKSKVCRDGAAEANYDPDLKEKGYPRCFLDDAWCREAINNFLPSICVPPPTSLTADKTEL